MTSSCGLIIFHYYTIKHILLGAKCIALGKCSAKCLLSFDLTSVTDVHHKQHTLWLRCLIRSGKVSCRVTVESPSVDVHYNLLEVDTQITSHGLRLIN